MKALFTISLLLVSSLASATQVCGDVAIDVENGIYRMIVTDPKSGEKNTMMLEPENEQVISFIRSIQGLNDEYTQLMICMEGQISDDGRTFSTPGNSVEFKIRSTVRK